MPECTLKIAGHRARLTAEFESTPLYFREYLTTEPPEVHLAATSADRQREQQLLLEEALAEGMKPRHFGEPFLERQVFQRKMAEFLFAFDILLLHGSTVALDGGAYLFTAACGTGKSTHTRLWCREFAGRAEMLNDDKPFLTLTDAGVLASGSPWTGKHGLGRNLTLPLKGICLLERGPKNQIRRACAGELLPSLLHQSFCPEGQEDRLAALVETLANRVPLWHLTCTKDPEAARVACDAMTQC